MGGFVDEGELGVYLRKRHVNKDWIFCDCCLVSLYELQFMKFATRFAASQRTCIFDFVFGVLDVTANGAESTIAIWRFSMDLMIVSFAGVSDNSTHE